MSEVKKCPKCRGKMVKGSEQTLSEAFRCTRPDSKILEQYSYKIQPFYCEICGYIEFYKEKKEQDMSVKDVENEELVEEARNALLQHFSSKSTNQTTILLSLALVFFAFVQTLQLDYINNLPDAMRIIYIVLSLTLFSFFTLRAIGRLCWWGAMATAVLEADISKKDGTIPQRLFDKSADENAPTKMPFIGYFIRKLTRGTLKYVLFFVLLFDFSLLFSLPWIFNSIQNIPSLLFQLCAYARLITYAILANGIFIAYTFFKSLKKPRDSA